MNLIGSGLIQLQLPYRLCIILMIIRWSKMYNRKIKFICHINSRREIKIIIIIILIISLFITMNHKKKSNTTWNSWTTPLSGKIILLDAGHGGYDGGAVSQSGIVEKIINLNICFFLRDYLQQSGAIVKITRESDKDLASNNTHKLSERKTEDLKKRASMISESKADVFISIHLNSMSSNKWKGAQTFFTLNNKDNRILASLIQEEFIKNLENTNRVSKTIDTTIYLLKMSKIPSVLIEAGFLSNETEAEQLSSVNYQKKIANAVYQGILSYFTETTK